MTAAIWSTEQERTLRGPSPEDRLSSVAALVGYALGRAG